MKGQPPLFSQDASLQKYLFFKTSMLAGLVGARIVFQSVDTRQCGGVHAV